VPVAAMGPPAAMRNDEGTASTRSPFGTVALLIAGIAVGLIGGYAVWGRGAEAPADTPATAASSTAAPPAPGPAPAPSREFSEQTVAPPAAAGARPDSSLAGSDPRAAAPPRPASPSSGTLVVRSTPAGAGVTLNGRWRGRTPLTLDALPFRRYDVRVVQPGYAAVAETVVLSADSPARSLALQLSPQSAAARARPGTPEEPASAAARPATRPAAPPAATRAAPRSTVFTGSIYVDSRPRGARVTVDGKAVGVTPLRVPDVRIGTHVVRLELADHRWWSTTTRVTAGQEQRVTGSLEPIK
jgi:PEGA domain